MSTEFYRLKKPFTSARAEITGVHIKLTLWVNHANAGWLMLRQEELPSVLLSLKRENCSLIRSAASVGEVSLRFEEDDLEPHTTLISEYGELTCLEEIDPTGKLTAEA